MRRVTLAVAVLLTTGLVAAAGVGVADVGARETAEGARPCGFPHETADATGARVTLDAPPERVVTLNPSAAQTMWEIGARDRVVGVTKYANYLDGAAERANVSGATDIVVVEQVVAAEPDLVLAPNATSRETVEQLRGAGLTVYHFPSATGIDAVSEKTRTIGRLVGECRGAEATVEWMRDRIGTAREAAAGRERPDVLYAFFGYTAGRNTFVHAVIEAGGGNNVAADYGVAGYRQLSPEVVVEADPDWILRNSNDPALPEGAPYNATTAVREGQVLVLPIEHLNQPAPRIVLGIAALAEHLHPGADAAANATAETGGDAGTADGATTAIGAAGASGSTAGTTAVAGTESPGQPGFGLLAGLVGLLGGLLVVRGTA